MVKCLGLDYNNNFNSSIDTIMVAMGTIKQLFWALSTPLLKICNSISCLLKNNQKKKREKVELI
jgi:hypothetical protein